MEGVIANFRRGRHTQSNSHMIIYIEGFTKKEDTKKLIGKQVQWKSESGKEFNGKVASPHGNKGAIRVIFEKNLPGQSLGNKVHIS